jgi:D-alanyl-D-alanine carboxypeptidase (penicillin-binding protein 5/6)
MLGLAVSSGNDAAVAAALYMAPSVESFAGMMTAEARRMGLRVTRFVEPSGISEFNLTTATEYAVFCREYVRLHPRSLTDLHSVLEFAYPKAANVPAARRGNPGTIVQANRNNLLRTFPGTDGLKTGYIDESGYNIVLTAQRNGTRFIAVILGAPGRPNGEGERIRDSDGETLLSWAFDNFKTVRYPIRPIETARLWKGRQRRVELIPAEDADFSYPTEPNLVTFTAPVNRGQNIYQVTEFTGTLIAPLPATYSAGRLIISDETGELHRIPLVTAQACDQGNIFRRAWDSIRLFFQKVKRRLS